MNYIKTLSAAAVRNMDALIKQAADNGVHNEMAIASILAVVSKETGLVPVTEISYRNTSVKRIREIFPVALAKYTDNGLESLRENDAAFYNAVYGGRFGNSPTEGYKYRGRGYNGLTFKNNYAAMGLLINYDLVADPDAANEPDKAASILFEYMKRRFNMNKPIVLKRYGARDINDFRNLTVAVNAVYNANAGFAKDTRNTSNDGYAKAMKRVEELYKYVKTMVDNRQVYDFPTVVAKTNTKAVTFTVVVNAVAMDLTAATIVIKFKKWNAVKGLQKTLTVGTGITITNAVGGIFRVDSFVMDWRPDTYLFDIDITPADGIKRNWLKGKWVVTENID